MKKKHIITFLVALIMTIGLAACGSKQSSGATKQTLKLSTTAPLATIDISQSTGYGQTGNVYEGFYRLGKNGQATPGLAQKATKSADGKTWTLTLRPDAKWSDGSTITAQDFVYSWRRTVTPKTKSPYGYLFANIQNASAILAGKASPSSLGIKATSKRKVVVTLAKPLAYFKILMAYPLFSPQKATVVNKYGKKYATRSQYAVYSGPFEIKNWNGTGNTWQFVKNPYYWDHQAVKLHKISYQVVEDPATGVSLYDTGKLDLTPLAVNQNAKYQHDKDYKSYGYSFVAYLMYNFKAKNSTVRRALNNRDIRLAISQSINRTLLTKKALGSGSLTPTGFVARNLAKDPATGVDFGQQQKVSGTIDYAPSEAKKHWHAGLKKLGLKKLSLTLLAPSDDLSAKTASEYLKAQLPAELPGLQIEVKTQPSQSVNQLETQGDFDFSISGWGADFNDPISFLQIPLANTSYNYGHYNNANYNALINRAENTDANNAAKRWQDLVQAARVFNADQGFTPLYQQVTAYRQKLTVHGIIHNTAGTQWSYKYAYIK